MRKLLLSLLLFPAALRAQQVKPAWETQPTYWDSGAVTYDGAGNIRAIGTDTYVYDAFGRLKSATAMTPAYPDNKQTFEYDPYGNQLKKTTFTGGQEHITNYLVNGAKNQLTTDGTCPPVGLCVTGFYDAAGNQLGTVPNVVDYKWDALGMMSESNLTSRPEEYVYDANDERVVSMVKPGGTQRFTLRGANNQVARELTRNPATGAWSWSRDYVYRDGALFAAFVGGESGPGPHRHYHLDHLGTPRLITDSGGYKLSTHTYWPYGKEAPGSEADTAERLRFTGHEYDSNPAAPGGDLYYMHARYYGQDWGRFLTVDPVLGEAEQPQSWNRYAYARNAPLSFTDPSGQCIQDPEVSEPCTDMEITVESTPLNYTIFDTAADFFDGVGFTIFEKSGVGDVLVGMLNDNPKQIAKGYGKQLLIAAPGAAGATTTPVTRVFWSGGRAVAGEAATAYAETIGGKTLEMTMTGKVLEWASEKFGQEAMRPAWNLASRMFARGASGEVVAVHGTSVATGSTWATVEYPILSQNSAVTGIQYFVVVGGKLLGTP